ncbi:50S ribosomal protein L20 [Trichinella britovi]|uniref:50S ribosomal protein L20 n=1 Tax=Trichinella britovi TaxID=45882 RepID=A0A0V1DG69_TRIBR|nr:50S ribosomal protein L20 [Trichinella britovi]
MYNFDLSLFYCNVQDSASLRHPQTAVVEPTFRRSERSSLQTVMIENLNTVGVSSEQQLLSLASFVDAQCPKAETMENMVLSECSSPPANFKDFSSDSVFTNDLTPSCQRVSTCTPATVVRRRSPRLDIMKNGIALENLFNTVVDDKSASEMENEYSSMKERLIDEINEQAIEIQKVQDDIARWKEQNMMKKKTRDEIQCTIKNYEDRLIEASKEMDSITKNMEYVRVLDDRNQILEDLISAENVISELQKRYEKFCLSYKNCLENDAKLKACLEEGRKNFLQSTNRMMQLKEHVKELMKTVLENKDEAVVSQREDLVALTAEVKKNELAVQTLKEDCDQMDKQIQELSKMVFLSCAKWFPRRFLNSPHPIDFPLPKRTRWFKRQRVFRFTGWYYADARDKYSPALNHLQHAWQKMTEHRKDLPEMRNWYYEKRVQAAANEHGVSYEQLKESLNKANIRLNTKMLSLLGSNEPRSFKSLMDVCKMISQESAKVPTNTSSAL